MGNQRSVRLTGPSSFAVGLAFALMAAGPLTPPAPAATDEQVDAAIEKAIKAILARQQTEWAIRAYKRERKEVLKKVPEGGKMVEKLKLEEWEEVPTDTFFGELLETTPGGERVFRKKDGQVIRVPKPFVAYCEPPGHFHPEQSGNKKGGSTCVATLALLEAGVSHNNPQIQAALKLLEGYPLELSYCRALRANIYAVLVDRVRDQREQNHYRRLLSEDMRWLERAMSEDGWYHYGAKTERGKGDHSCSQFGVLGMWACANVGMEIPESYWRIVEEQWLANQGTQGPWSYVGRPPDVIPPARPGDAPRNDLPRVTMTTAGVNTLYVVLDKLHTRLEAPYKWLRGIRPDPQTRQAVADVFNAIDGGLKWMASHDAASSSSNYYQRFGLERLGVASGLKYIGDVDWYAANANVLVNHKWTGDPVNDGFYLIFLVYGRAPIVFNKLQWGQPDQWNYYFRDLHYLCRFLNHEFEKIHKWQIVKLDSPLHDLLDAPILYVNGSGEFDPSKKHLDKLREFCEAGGTIVGHPNRKDKKFSTSFKKAFVDVFGDRGYTFEELSKDHPVFSTHFGRSKETRFRRSVPLEGMSDGGRTFVFFFDGDLAGAWHQNRSITYSDAFKIMANIRFYAAPGYEQLPGRLRPEGLPGKPVEPKGTLTIGRVKHNADWDTNPTAWNRMDRHLSHYHGVTIKEVKGVEIAGASKLKDIDLLHITGHGTLKLSASELDALTAYLADGGTVLIDACGGDQAFSTSAGKIIDRMYPDQSELLIASHPIVQGGPGGTKPLTKLRPTGWSLSRMRGRDAPPIAVVQQKGRVALLFAPFDLTASMDGHFIYQMHGYQRESALRIMTNLLMWRFEQRAKQGA